MTTGQKRWGIVGVLALATVGIELGVRIARRPSAGLALVNAGSVPIRNLVISYAGVQVVVGDVASGARKRARLEVRPGDVVTVAFEQEGNASPGAQLDGTELDQARRDGLRLVLTFQPGQVVRFLEDDEVVEDDSPLARLWSWVYRSLFATPPAAANPGVLRGWPW